MTNQTFLQSKIEEKAKERIQKDIIQVKKLLLENPILSKLGFNIPDVSTRDNKTTYLIGDINNLSCVFSKYTGEFCLDSTKEQVAATNFKEVTDKLLEKYIKEEGDLLLEKLGILTDYLE